MHPQEQMNKLGAMPISKLMRSMGLPMILSMMLQALYNIVDSAFVSNMSDGGELALNALTLAFPVQVLMIAIGIGTGIGTNALLSKSLGQGDFKKVSKVAGNGVFLALVIYLLFVLFAIFGLKPYVDSQTSNPVIAEMTMQYLKICCFISFGIVFFSIYEKLLQATGRPLFSTIAQVLGAVTNIVLDPIIIYGYLGFPEMGVSGAAYATVIGQIVSFVLALVFHLKFDKEISNKLIYFKPCGKIIKEIYSIGVPAIIAQALMSVMTYALNIILVAISESAVTAYGLYYKIQQFVLFAAFGLRDAITPIVSFNYGMQSVPRIRSGIKYGMIYTLGIMLIGFAVIEIFASPLAGVFGLSQDTEALCISAMRIISLSFVFAGANIAFQGIFQALGSGIETLIISVLRQLLFVLPVAWGFSQLMLSLGADTSVVWYTFVISEGATAAVSCLLMKRIYRKKSQGSCKTEQPRRRCSRFILAFLNNMQEMQTRSKRSNLHFFNISKDVRIVDALSSRSFQILGL